MGNDKALDAVAAKGLLIATERLVHKYPYDWRTKKPVIVR